MSDQHDLEVKLSLNAAGVASGAKLAGQAVQLTDAQMRKLVKTLEDNKKKLAEAAAEGARLEAQMKAVTAQIDAQIAANKNLDRSALEHIEGLHSMRSEYEQVIDKQIEYGSAVDELGSAISEATTQQKEAAQASRDLGEGAEAAAAKSEHLSRMLVGMALNGAAAAARLNGNEGLANALQIAATAASAFMLATGPLGIAMASISALVSIISVASSAAERQAQKTKEAMESIKASASDAMSIGADTAAAKGYINTLKDITSTIDDQSAARRALAQMFPEAIQGYTSEGEAILSANEGLRARVELMEKEAELHRRASASSARDMFDSYIGEYAKLAKGAAEAKKLYDELVADMDSAKKEIREGGGEWDSSGWLYQIGVASDDMKNKYAELQVEQVKVIDQFRIMTSDLMDEMGDLSEAQISAAAEARDAYLSENEALIDSMVAMNPMEREAEWREIYDGLSEAMRTATTDSGLLADAKQRIADVNHEVAKSYADIGQSTSSAYDEMRKILTEFERIGNMKGAVKVMEDFTKSAKSGQKETKLHADAVKFLAQQFNVTEDEIKKNLPMYKNEIALKEAMAQADYAKAAAAAFASRAEVESMVVAGTVTRAQADVMIAALDDVIKKYVEYAQTAGAGGVPINFDFSGIKTGGGGGGGGAAKERKAAWEEELELIERVKGEMDDMGYVYVDILEKMLEDQRLSAEGRERVEKELVYANKGIAGQLQQDYVAYLEGILSSQKLSAEKRLEVEKKLVQATKDMYKEQIAALDELGNAVIEALRRKYTEQMEAQQAAAEQQATLTKKGAQDEIAAINASRDARIAAINEEIRLLDEAWKARQRSKEDESDEDALQRLRTQMAHTQDEYNQKQLLAAITRKEEQIAEREEKRAYDDKKKELQDQIALVRSEAQIAIEEANKKADGIEAALGRQQQANEAYWKKRLSDEVLMGEALYTLQNGSQEEIMELLETYHPEYLRQGQTMGQMLYDGFDEKYISLLNRTKQVADDIVAQANRAISAWQEMQSATGSGGGGGSGARSAPAGRSMLFSTVQADNEQLFDSAAQVTMMRQAGLPLAQYAAMVQSGEDGSGRSVGNLPSFMRPSYDRVVIEAINIQTPVKSEYELMREAQIQLQRVLDWG